MRLISKYMYKQKSSGATINESVMAVLIQSTMIIIIV